MIKRANNIRNIPKLFDNLTCNPVFSWNDSKKKTTSPTPKNSDNIIFIILDSYLYKQYPINNNKAITRNTR